MPERDRAETAIEMCKRLRAICARGTPHSYVETSTLIDVCSCLIVANEWFEADPTVEVDTQARLMLEIEALRSKGVLPK